MHQLDRLCYAVVVLVVIGATVAEAATGTFIYAGCSPSKYQPGTPFEGNLNSLLASIANAAPNGGYNSFTAGSNGAAYAASLQLEGCYVRYDSSNFVGQPDNAMVYRKCSTSTSGDGDFLKNRDAVLAALQGGLANGYKVSSSGNVQGVSQCLGDLAAGDCTTCLAQAVGQLKGTCGTSLAADVYLAQCYVRYWANGFYFRPSQDYSQDDVGRTVAIIVGILAGLAILVVFISFLRKSC